MTEQRSPLLSKILNHLDKVEKIFLTVLLVGIILPYLNLDNITVIKVSLIALAITYFIASFKTLEIPIKENDEVDFKQFLYWWYVPRLLWISISFSLYGLFIYTLLPGHNGHKLAFLVCGLTIAIGLIILTYAFITGTKYLTYVLPIVWRAVLILIIDFYLLFYK